MKIFTNVTISTCPRIVADLSQTPDGKFAVYARLQGETAFYPVDPAAKYNAEGLERIPGYIIDAVKRHEARGTVGDGYGACRIIEGVKCTRSV